MLMHGSIISLGKWDWISIYGIRPMQSHLPNTKQYPHMGLKNE